MKGYAGNQSFLKDLNLTTALRKIHFQGLISRAELADLLGLNRSTITSIINELLERRLVQEVGVGAAKGGRPPTLLQFNKSAGYIASVDCGSQKIKIYITDLGGEVFYKTSLDFHKENPTNQIKQIISIIRENVEKLPTKDLGLLGVGIAVTGLVENGIIKSYNLEWYDVPIHSYFSEEFDCPIYIDSDANAGLIAEKYYGSAVGEKNVCYLRVGRGISAGLLMNGELYKGNHGFAGRVGHTTLESNGKKCSCGNRGCWEVYVSENALIRNYLNISGLKESDEEVSVQKIIKLARESDPHAISVVHELGEYLGIGISNLINFLNPGLVIVGSSIDELEIVLNKQLNHIVQQRILPLLKRDSKVIFSSLGEDAVMLGVVAMVLDNMFSTPSVN
jgi:predicted NBD/HSP70 family sugar kinase